MTITIVMKNHGNLDFFFRSQGIWHCVASGCANDQLTFLNIVVVSIIPSLTNWEARLEDRAGFLIFI
jgi:hypothetical protein